MKTVTITQEEYDELLKAKAYYDEAEAIDPEKGVYEFNVEFRRGGSLNGIFVVEHKYAQAIVESGVEVCFGEVLGKHSDISGSIDADELVLVSSKQKAINSCRPSGYNPFNYETPEGEMICDYLDRYLSGELNKTDNDE